MREIKFRAWHEWGDTTGRFLKPGMIYDEKSGDCLKWLNDGQKITNIMQYTGLKDRNGKEIYEGDVFKTELTDSIGVVKFSHGVFGLRWQPPEQNRMLGSWGQKHDLRRFDDGQILEIGAVVGNIHENPELIK